MNALYYVKKIDFNRLNKETGRIIRFQQAQEHHFNKFSYNSFAEYSFNERKKIVINEFAIQIKLSYLFVYVCVCVSLCVN